MSEMNNKWNNCIEEAVSKRHIKHYEYEHFSNIQEIGTGGFGKVYRANWKNLRQHFALKSLHNINDIAIKELVHEVIIRIYLHTTKHFYMYFWFKSYFIYNLSRLNFIVKSLSIIISLAFMGLLFQTKVINKIIMRVIIIRFIIQFKVTISFFIRKSK